MKFGLDWPRSLVENGLGPVNDGLTKEDALTMSLTYGADYTNSPLRL